MQLTNKLKISPRVVWLLKAIKMHDIIKNCTELTEKEEDRGLNIDDVIERFTPFYIDFIEKIKRTQKAKN